MKRRLILLAVFSVLVLAVAPVAAEQQVPTSSITASPAGVINEAITDGGFETSYDPIAGFGLNDFWGHESIVYDDGYGFLNDPGFGHNGSDWYAVLGGAGGAGETASIWQDVTLGDGSATLTFYLGCNGGDGDTLEVQMDGDVVYTDTCPSDHSWLLVTVDASAYANGTTRELRFVGTDSVGGTTNWLIDDVSLVYSVDLDASMYCDPNLTGDLLVQIDDGDGPFNILENGNVVHSSVGVGTHTLDSSLAPFDQVTVVELDTDNDEESVNLGDRDCTAQTPLQASSTECVDVDRQVVITAGDAPFEIDWDENPGAALSAPTPGTYSLPGPGTFTNVTVTELNGNTESVNLNGDSAYACWIDLVASWECATDFSGDMIVTIEEGDGPFDILEDGAVLMSSVLPNTYYLGAILSPFTTVTVEEQNGDMESVALFTGDRTCPSPIELVVDTYCEGDDLVIDILSGNRPFNIFADSGPVPLDAVGLGQTVLNGPATWANLRVVEEGQDYQTVFLGNQTCSTGTTNITIVKNAIPQDGTDFSFSGDLGPFTLDHAVPNDYDGYGQALTFPVSPGVYSVTENVPMGWDLKNIRCSDRTVVLNNDTVNIEIEEGEDITCYFNNQRYPGSITIIKEAWPADGTDFEFASPFGNFFLDDAEPDDGDAYSDVIGWFPVEAGTYTFSEINMPDGWFLSDIHCEAYQGSPDFSYFGNGVEMTLYGGESITCWFHNEQPSSGAIEIFKSADYFTDEVFAFDGDLGPFELGAGDNALFINLQAGTYDIYEMVPMDWMVGNIDCWTGDPNDTTVIDVANGMVSIDLDGGEYVGCNFQNHFDPRPASVTVFKDAQPADGTVFDFDGTLGPFSLMAGEEITLPVPFSNPDPEYVHVSEMLSGSWHNHGVQCVSGDTVLDFGGGEFELFVLPGEQWRCTFTNREYPQVTIVKEAAPDNTGQVFEFTSVLGDCSLADGESCTLGLGPMQYDVYEVVPDGWYIADIMCDSPNVSYYDDGIHLNLNWGEHATCTFYNEQYGAITILKEAEPGDTGQSFDFTGDLGDFSLMDGETVAMPGLTAGDYYVEESLPAGWQLDMIECNLGVGAASNYGTTITLGPGEGILCTFYNSEIPPEPGSITIVKEAQPADTGTEFDFTGDLGDFALESGESYTANDLAAGDYSVSEVGEMAWIPTQVQCSSDGPNSTFNTDSGLAEITLADGENVTCVFNNLKVGSITVVKEADPSDDTVFSFTGSGPLGDGFDLMDGESEYFEYFPGSTTVTELDPGGDWELVDIVCTGSTGDVDVDLATGTVVVDRNPGDNVVCTFYNEIPAPTGMITIIKEATPADGTDFEFTGPDGAFYLDDADPDDGDAVTNSMTFELEPGLYSFSEVVPDGWNQTRISCDFEEIQPSAGFSFGLTVYLNANQHITCTFHNEQPAPAEQFGPGHGDAPQRNDPSQPYPAEDVLYGVDLLAWLNN